MSRYKPIQVVDIFAGPGGLGEGFSSFMDRGARRFEIALSIEKDSFARKTLLLRSFFRKLSPTKRKTIYKYYIDTKPETLSQLALNNPKEWLSACQEAVQLELAPETRKKTNELIKQRVNKENPWVLVGGPPCQAYSLVGRARRSREARQLFESDKKHTLYQEYLHILNNFKPPVFVMENVKGILSATYSGEQIFQRICNDLADQGYRLYSLTGESAIDLSGRWLTESFVVRAEKYGIPQARHRVFILGIRDDLKVKPASLTPKTMQISIDQALEGIPSLRSRLSTSDTFRKWLEARNTGLSLAGESMKNSIADFFGSEFVNCKPLHGFFLSDKNMPGLPNHEARSHLTKDIQRYAFASAYAFKTGKSPKVTEFPDLLKPDHKNICSDQVPFTDRFKVQMFGKPSSTITSHISKDGHYYIHPDFKQARSLTVREAARLQTFPDNYRFEGPRTEQYKQVGNAVPPILAKQIAKLVHDLI